MIKIGYAILDFFMLCASWLFSVIEYITRPLPIIHYYIVDLKNHKAVRNDFMSHMSYVYLLVSIGMFITYQLFANINLSYSVGFILGILGAFIRESYDEHRAKDWDLMDILAALIGTILALICMFSNE